MSETIYVKDVCQYAMFDTDGIALRHRILQHWNTNKKIILDFEHIGLFATMFFNASIGWFVMQYGDQEVKERISVINLSALGLETYRHSFDNAVTVRQNSALQDALSTYTEE